MTDIDDRSHSRDKKPPEDPTIVKRLVCNNCGYVTLVTRKWRERLMKQLDPKYPSQTVTIECTKCKHFQFIIQATWVNRGRS